MRSRLECRCRLSPRLSRSMTATGRRGCRRICCRRSATSLARIRTSASTSRGASSSIRTGLGAVDGSLRQLITLNFFCVIEGRAGSAMLLALFVVIEKALASDQHMAIAWVLAKEGGHCLPDRVAQGLSDSGGSGRSRGAALCRGGRQTGGGGAGGEDCRKQIRQGPDGYVG